MTIQSTFDGIKILYRSTDGAVINEVFHENSYRIDLIPEKGLVIDIGAHIGTFSLRCAKERKCSVYAYEPYLPSFSILLKNIKQNRLQRRIKPFNLAVAGSRGSRTFYAISHCSESNTLYKPPDPDIEELEVNCVTISDIFADNNLTECDVLKLDCEGAEKEIFSDEFATYLRCVSRILLEWHNYDGALYAEFLKKLGFLVSLTGCGCPAPPYHPSFARGMLYADRIE